jgi:hypothetical protein
MDAESDDEDALDGCGCRVILDIAVAFLAGFATRSGIIHDQ